MVQPFREADVLEEFRCTPGRVAVRRRDKRRRQYVLDDGTLRQQTVVLKDETDLLVAKCGELFRIEQKWILSVQSDGPFEGGSSALQLNRATCSCRCPMGP